MADPLDMLNRAPRDGGIAGMLLSTVRYSRVLAIYDHVLENAALAVIGRVADAVVEPEPLDFMNSARLSYGRDNEYATSDHVVLLFNRFFANTIAHAENRFPIHINQLERIRIDDLPMNEVPVNVSGELQYVFSVNQSFRGVAAVARLPIKMLVARCLIGLEMVAYMAEYDGPFFAIAFNGTDWRILMLPVYYLDTDMIYIREGVLNFDNQHSFDDFVCNLREALLLAVQFEY